MRDLYEVLGVQHDADTGSIRRAFRAKSKVLHPDCGGGVEDYQELALAKEILTDPDRRSHYDRTGRDSGVRESSVIAEAKSLLSQALGEIIKAPSGGVDDIASVDIIAGLRIILTGPLQQRRSELAQGRASMDQAECRLKRLQGRFKRKDKGDNILEMLLRGHLSQIQQARDGIAKAEEELKPHEMALKMLDNYEFAIEEARPMFHFTQTQIPTNTTNAFFKFA